MRMFLVLFALITNLLFLPIDRVEREHPLPLEGRYLGTSSFHAANAADSGYTETVPIWFEFADSTYRYGIGEDFPVPETTEQFSYGFGPYTVVDSTVTLAGATNKILRPAVVLSGEFQFTMTGDTLELAQAQTSFPAGLHAIRLIRQR